MTTKPLAIILVIICTAFTSLGQLFFKLGSASVTDAISFFNLYVILGLFFYFLGAALLVLALKYGELSVLYPFIALTFVWVSFLSVSFLDEVMGLQKWLGIVVIVAGVSFIGVGAKK